MYREIVVLNIVCPATLSKEADIYKQIYTYESKLLFMLHTLGHLARFVRFISTSSGTTSAICLTEH